MTSDKKNWCVFISVSDKYESIFTFNIFFKINFFLKNVGGLWPQYVLVHVCGIVWYFIYYTIVAWTPSNENYVSQDFVWDTIQVMNS